MSGPVVSVAAQAKLNLHLRVLAKEDSGFHSIETVFHRIDLADQLRVEVTDGPRSLDATGGLDLGPVEKNLAWRAGVAYSKRAGWPDGFRIELEKRIPVGAGLGGGSADAAAMLRALDTLSPRPLGTDALVGIAATLGSDVPFLASDFVMALAWGRGERMLGLPPLEPRDVLLLVPQEGVLTAEAYDWLDSWRSEARDDAPGEAPDLQSLTSWSSLAARSANDFEQPVMARRPAVGRSLEWLRDAGATLARMSGSGSAMFGVFDGPATHPRQRDPAARLIETRTSLSVVPPIMAG